MQFKPPQGSSVFRFGIGREMRRMKAGGIDLLSKVAVDFHFMMGLGDVSADLCTSCETEAAFSLT